MAILLYCVTPAGESVSITNGVCDAVLQPHEFAGLRVYWSEIANPEACFADAELMKKSASQFQQVLRQILSATTLLPFPFPTLLESVVEMEDHLKTEQPLYRSAFETIGDAVQYEIIASWIKDEQADLAMPIRGREYVKRRQEAAERVAAVDSKLKSVTGDSVRAWRVRQERRMHRWFALVARKDRERFITSLRSADPSQGVRLHLSGPWPATEFVISAGNNR
jgi:Gas vesicle synthesis protein GvpL/GvpF